MIVAVEECVCVPDCVVVELADGVAVSVAVVELVALGDAEEVCVDEGVLVESGVSVAVLEWVPDAVLVSERVGVREMDDVGVREDVGVPDGNAVVVSVKDQLAVLECVGVAVRVNV